MDKFMSGRSLHPKEVDSNYFTARDHTLPMTLLRENDCDPRMGSGVRALRKQGAHGSTSIVKFSTESFISCPALNDANHTRANNRTRKA